MSAAPVNFERFHEHEVPQRLATTWGRRIAEDVRQRAPLALRLREHGAYTYTPTQDGIAVTRGDTDAATVVELDAAAWRDLLRDDRSIPSLLYGRALEVTRGKVAVLFDWEPALRALIQERPLYDPATLDLRDPDGAPLDLGTTFTVETPPASVARFLSEAGFAVVRGVFTPDEMTALRNEADRLAAEARPGDRRSWWARNATGTQVLCRVTYAPRTSPTIGALNADRRVLDLVRAFAPDYLAASDRLDGIALIIKNPNIVDGLSDLPWHVDCGMGGHPTLCPILQFSVMLDAASPETGTLKFLAGSHRYVTRLPADEQDLPVVTVEAAPGDCVLHLSDTMHAAPSPTGTADYRRSLVTSFYRPSVLDRVPTGKAFNDVLLSRDDGHVENLRQLARD